MVNFMNSSVQYIKDFYKDNPDFILRKIDVNWRDKVYVLFFESLCDSGSIYNFVLKNLYDTNNFNKKVFHIERVLSGPKLVKVESEEKIFYYLENGFCVVIFKKEMWALEVKANIDRGITDSQTEPNMYGPKDAFCENYQKNLGLIKRRVKSKNMACDSVDVGEYTKTKISLIYIKDKVNNKTINKIKNKLNKYRFKDVVDSFDISKNIESNKVFPTIFKTEKPAIVSQFLLDGYAVLLIDNTPFVLILDAKLKDFINPSTTDKFVIVLRYLCFILTVLTPAIYIALINFNQETIPTSLLINFSEQRSGVPFPAIIEAFIMLFVCEILRETDIRFPSNYGSSASILGALILGDAAVNAGIVSPIMIIVIAITFITNLIFTEIKLVWAIRIMRVAFLITSSLLGLYGLSLAIILCLIELANVKVYEGNYL